MRARRHADIGEMELGADRLHMYGLPVIRQTCSGHPDPCPLIPASLRVTSLTSQLCYRRYFF